MTEQKKITIPPAQTISKADPETVRKKVPFADELLATQQEAIKTKAAAQVLGIEIGEKKDPGESLATSIVTKSMDIQQDAIKRMDNEAGKLREEVKEAQAAASQMQFALLNDKLGRIEEAQKKSDAAAREAAGTGAPKSAFDYYGQVKGELEKLLAGMKTTPEPSHQGGLSETTTIELKKLELEQQRVLAQIAADNARADREFNLKMAEFVDNKELKREEYKDKKMFREQGLQGVSDIVAAIGAGLRGEMGGVQREVTSEETPDGRESEMGAYISQFPCTICGTPVPVEQGDTTAKCPSPECGAVFQIKPK